MKAQFMSDDDAWRALWNRLHRLKRLVELDAPRFVIENEIELVERAATHLAMVSALIEDDWRRRR